MPRPPPPPEARIRRRRTQALAALAVFVSDTAARSDLAGQTGWQQRERQALRVLAGADDLIRLGREFVEVVVNHNQVLPVECQCGTQAAEHSLISKDGHILVANCANPERSFFGRRKEADLVVEHPPNRTEVKDLRRRRINPEIHAVFQSYLVVIAVDPVVPEVLVVGSYGAVGDEEVLSERCDTVNSALSGWIVDRLRQNRAVW